MHLTLNERAVSTQYFFSAGVVVCAFSVVVLHAFCGYFSILFYVSSAGIVLRVFCGYFSMCLPQVLFDMYVSSVCVILRVFCVCALF